MIGRIVVAEDDVDLRAALVTLLRREGHQVVEVAEAASLRAEVDRALGENPSSSLLVIVDLRLGGADALDAVEQLCSRYAAIGVILISGAWTAAQQDRGRALGARALLSKPFHFRHLRQLVRKFERDSSG